MFGREKKSKLERKKKSKSEVKKIKIGRKKNGFHVSLPGGPRFKLEKDIYKIY